MGDVGTWALFLIINIGVVGMVVYQLLCLMDLGFDIINPYDTASRINMVVLPEFIAHAVLSCLFLVTGHWVMALLTIPYFYYNVRLYSRREHLIDVTEILNLLNREKKKRLFKLGYLALFVYVTLFWLVYSALEGEDHFV